MSFHFLYTLWFYSLLSVSTGFARAAFTERELIVIAAITIVINNEIINGMTVESTKGDNPKFNL